MNHLITVLIVIILIFILYKTQNKKEGFLSLNKAVRNFDDFKNPQLSYYYQWGHPIHSTIHATLGKGNVVERYDFKPPAYRGVYGCTQTSCPDNLDPEIMCWCCCNFH